MKRLSALLILAIAACTPQDIGPASGKARFSEYPAPFFEIFRISCSGPTRTFRSAGRGSAECRELMPPELTAAFILEYSGTPDDLPRLVIRFRARDDGQSYLVSNDVFVNIPQRSGAPRQVPFQDARLRRELEKQVKSTAPPKGETDEILALVESR